MCMETWIGLPLPMYWWNYWRWSLPCGTQWRSELSIGPSWSTPSPGRVPTNVMHWRLSSILELKEHSTWGWSIPQWVPAHLRCGVWCKKQNKLPPCGIRWCHSRGPFEHDAEALRSDLTPVQILWREAGSELSALVFLPLNLLHCLDCYLWESCCK